MAESDPKKVELGKRLAEARDLAEMTQATVAVSLTNAGLVVKNKKTVSAWESGRNVPDALVLRQLAKLYKTSADSLLGIQQRSALAERLAVIFDSLEPEDRADFLKVSGPFLEKHARSTEPLARTNDDQVDDDELSPEKRRLLEENARAMARRSTPGRKRSA